MTAPHLADGRPHLVLGAGAFEGFRAGQAGHLRVDPGQVRVGEHVSADLAYCKIMSKQRGGGQEDPGALRAGPAPARTPDPVAARGPQVAVDVTGQRGDDLKLVEGPQRAAVPRRAGQPPAAVGGERGLELVALGPLVVDRAAEVGLDVRLVVAARVARHHELAAPQVTGQHRGDREVGRERRVPVGMAGRVQLEQLGQDRPPDLEEAAPVRQGPRQVALARHRVVQEEIGGPAAGGDDAGERERVLAAAEHDQRRRRRGRARIAGIGRAGGL